MLAMLDNILGNDPELRTSIAVANFGSYKNQIIKYQVMTDNDFFDWYCLNYPDGQFYDTPFMAVQQYLKNYIMWIENGKPKYDG